MAELKDQIRKDLTAAMKAKDELVKGVLRMTLTALNEAAVAGSDARDLTNDEEIAVVAKEVAKRKDAAQAFTEGGRTELAEKELAEAEVLAGYLPKPLTEAEIEAIVAEEYDRVAAEIGATPGRAQMGVLMKAIKGRTGSRADGKVVANLVRAKLG